jgi:5'-nucleotidase
VFVIYGLEVDKKKYLSRYSLFKYEPLLKFANMLKYDAMGLGNHDFDDGVEGLVPFINGSTFAVLAANIVSLT